MSERTGLVADEERDKPAGQDPETDFFRRITRGREFENYERSQWKKEVALAQFEVPTRLEGKRGREDIRLVDNKEGFTVVVEIKASNWDVMKPERVRPNALRHARQLWRYIEAELHPQDVIPAVVYPIAPQMPGRKDEIEAIFEERLIQVVWRIE